MLNAIGLQNPGIDVFVQRDIPFLKQFDTKIIVNVCGRSAADYVEVVERLAQEPVDMLEINVSCPNVKHGGIAFGQDPKCLLILQGNQRKGKAANYYEAFAQCDRYRRDGKSSRSGGKRCHFID